MLRYKTGRTWFSHLLRHPARKRSGSILTTLEPAWEDDGKSCFGKPKSNVWEDMPVKVGWCLTALSAQTGYQSVEKRSCKLPHISTDNISSTTHYLHGTPHLLRVLPQSQRRRLQAGNGSTN